VPASEQHVKPSAMTCSLSQQQHVAIQLGALPAGMLLRNTLQHRVVPADGYMAGALCMLPQSQQEQHYELVHGSKCM
jgi:hypothetical protein